MSEKWVDILITYDVVEAEIVRDVLESGGIPVVMRSSKVGPYPVNVGKMGEVKLLVREEDWEIAEKAIRTSADSPDSPPVPHQDHP